MAHQRRQPLGELVEVALQLLVVLHLLLVAADQLAIFGQRFAAPREKRKKALENPKQIKPPHLLLCTKVLKGGAQLRLVTGRRSLGIGRHVRLRRQKDVGNLRRALVHSRADAALQHHLQNLRIDGLLRGGHRQLLRLLLHVLDCDLHRGEDHLVAIGHLHPRLHVGKGLGGGEHCLALALLVEFAVGAAVEGEGRGKDETL